MSHTWSHWVTEVLVADTVTEGVTEGEAVVLARKQDPRKLVIVVGYHSLVWVVR